jgi:hypothetical protein
MAHIPSELSALAQQISQFKTQTLSDLNGSRASGASAFDLNQLAAGYLAGSLTNTQSAGNTSASTAISSIAGLSPTGRNLALPDPESAYRMMSHINQLAVQYPAQSSRLSTMQEGVSQLTKPADRLASLSPTADLATVQQSLQALVDQYNQWRFDFNADLQDPELLAGTQAAQVARYELAQSIASPFHGAERGIQGMAVLGLTIDPTSQTAKLDPAQLAAQWQRQPEAAMAAINQFGAHFSRSANLLTERDNFFAKQQANLGRVIEYMQQNLPQLQQEFGLGDPAQPSPSVARAYADYQRRHAAV